MSAFYHKFHIFSTNVRSFSKNLLSQTREICENPVANEFTIADNGLIAKKKQKKAPKTRLLMVRKAGLEPARA